jgi:hypothetical protein
LIPQFVAPENVGYFVRVMIGHTYMDQRPTLEVQRWFIQAAQELWPVAVGSLSLRKTPCIRSKCVMCASGQGHSSYVLYGGQVTGKANI